MTPHEKSIGQVMQWLKSLFGKRVGKSDEHIHGARGRKEREGHSLSAGSEKSELLNHNPKHARSVR